MTQVLTAPTINRLQTHDPDLADEWLHAAYGTKMRTAGLHPGDELSYERLDASALAVDVVTFPRYVRWESQPLPSIVAVQIRDGRWTRQCGEFEDLAVAGDVVLAAAPGLPHEGQAQARGLHTTALDPCVLERVTQTGPRWGRAQIQFLSLRAASPDAAALWARTFGRIREIFSSPAICTPLVLAGCADLMAAVTLATFPNSYSAAPISGRDAHPAAMRRAIAFMEANSERDISAADIAEAARVSIRSLQRGFRQHAGTTPTRYLRRVRLTRAHEQLALAHPTDNLAQLAAENGFADVRRFRALYRSEYGKAPVLG